MAYLVPLNITLNDAMQLVLASVSNWDEKLMDLEETEKFNSLYEKRDMPCLRYYVLTISSPISRYFASDYLGQFENGTLKQLVPVIKSPVHFYQNGLTLRKYFRTSRA